MTRTALADVDLDAAHAENNARDEITTATRLATRIQRRAHAAHPDRPISWIEGDFELAELIDREIIGMRARHGIPQVIRHHFTDRGNWCRWSSCSTRNPEAACPDDCRDAIPAPHGPLTVGRAAARIRQATDARAALRIAVRVPYDVLTDLALAQVITSALDGEGLQDLAESIVARFHPAD